MAAILLFLKLELYWLVLDALVFNEFDLLLPSLFP
jgi:hypothetical protein